MNEFTSAFWPWYIFVLVALSIAAVFGLIRWMSVGSNRPTEKAKTMGHKWDDDLEELNNPLPRWWLNLFYITLFFSIGYLILYPGIGIAKGVLGWTQINQYEREIEAANKLYGPIFAQYLKQDVRAVAGDPEALKMGERLYLTYCTACHGSDARGGPGYPNLRDADWLYGGAPEQIKTSIMNGRMGVMPAWAQPLGQEGVQNVAEYVLSLSGRRVTEVAAEAGKEKFMQMCVVCHGADGRGNIALGAPDLTDGVWLYGGSQRAVMETIANGRQGRMPAHGEFLGEAKVHLLTAYVYSFLQEPPPQ
ncbi:MAG TPA: cytochrome-c oxidase, cbb3-type subunit III [Acidiferrobacterales bacterium]